MAGVGLVVHHDRPRALTLAAELAAWLRGNGHDVVLPEGDAAATGLAEHGCAEGELAGRIEVAVSLGGDGTMLRAVDLVAAAGVPVIGVNVGHLGYLTEVEPEGVQPALERFLAGRYDVEQRMMLSLGIERAGAHGSDASMVALNEAVLEKTVAGHTVRLQVDIDGEFFTTYATDGLIVATPTGSTAYAFSARGPIVAPSHRAIVLTPVAPHMLFDRTLVLGPDSQIRAQVCSDRPATLSVDGRSVGTLEDGDAVVCTAAELSAQLVTFGPRDFHRTLKAKFGLGDR